VPAVTLRSLTLSFFFFQAEDGIRDLYVTGVQTCALPISSRAASRRTAPPRDARAGSAATNADAASGPWNVRLDSYVFRTKPDRRSEERRVGKEWRARRAAYQ